MGARGYGERYNAFDDDDVVEQSHADEEDDDWDLFSSSSPSSSSPARAPAPTPTPALASVPVPTPARRIMPPASSPECSMDDDSSTDGEEVDTARSKRRAATLSQPADPRQSQAITLQQRRVKIKELQMKYQQECLALCRSLLPLQRQWRKELEDPIPGLISFDHLKQEETSKQREFLKSEAQMQRYVPKYQVTSAGTPDFKNAGMTATDSSLGKDSKPPLRRKLPWKGNEREAIRRGILMFGVGRSEKVRGVMRGSVKHFQHGLGDIADCSWEFVRACSVHADVKESAFVENLLNKAEDLGIEMGPEVSDRVGQWDKMEKLGGVWLKRIKLLDSLGHVIRLCTSPATQEIAYDAIDSLADATVPCDWWTRKSDLALLAGTYEHGFGNYEVLRMDDKFAEAFGPFWDKKISRERVSGPKGFVSNSHDQNSSKRSFDHDPDAELIARDSSSESSWPDTNLLTRRLKRLVEHLSRISEQEVDIEKESGKKVKHGQIWSKREKVNFLRMLFTWGFPAGGQVSWQFFKDQASVRPLKNKKDSSLEACYDELMKEMTQLLEGSELHESGAGSTDESDDKGHSELGEPSSQGPAILTHKTAGRLKERLELLDTLRQASQLFSEDWRNVGLSVQQSHNLPSWWQSGNHDRQLVMGVMKHGFGNWDTIFADDTYSFKLESEREKARRGGEDVDSLWDAQTNEEPDEFSKGKGKRSFSSGGASVFLPCPKSCVKRLRFIGSVFRHYLQKRYKMQSKGQSY